MAYTPRKASSDLTGSPLNVINAVRQGASVDYKEYVPYATNNADVIRKIGAILYDNPILFNEFANGLINQIGLVIFTSALFYENPWQFAVKGALDYGETVEEIYIGLCEPHKYDAAVAESKWMAREIPDVHTAFHVVNYQHFYKSTIQRETLQKAFMNVGSLERFITEVIGAMYTSAQYDIYQTLLYLTAILIKDGSITSVRVAGTDTETDSKNTVKVLRSTAPLLESMLPNFTISGVRSQTFRKDQILLINSIVEADLGVDVLASAFNLPYVEYMQRRFSYAPFQYLDVARLTALATDEKGNVDPTYHEFTAEELADLDNVVGILVDEDFYQCYVRLLESRTSPENGEGLYYNNWYHVWMIMGVSPFKNAVLFNKSASVGVSEITVSPSSATMYVGTQLQLSATVQTTGFASQAVTWTSSDEKVAVVDSAGMVTAIAAGSATITATSAADSTKTKDAEITVEG